MSNRRRPGKGSKKECARCGRWAEYWSFGGLRYDAAAGTIEPIDPDVCGECWAQAHPSSGYDPLGGLL